jgi:hypothetical protein
MSRRSRALYTGNGVLGIPGWHTSFWDVSGFVSSDDTSLILAAGGGGSYDNDGGGGGGGGGSSSVCSLADVLVCSIRRCAVAPCLVPVNRYYFEADCRGLDQVIRGSLICCLSFVLGNAECVAVL